MSPGPIGPLAPYFQAHTALLSVLDNVLSIVGTDIQNRKYIYHRGAFYANVAQVIRILLEAKVPLFEDSAYNWEWWATECEKRAAAIGNDAQFAMALPPPVNPALTSEYPKITNSLDKMLNLMLGVTKQEEEDTDISDLGNLTPAECAKLTHRFAHYWLGKRGGNAVGYVVKWPWLEAVAKELQTVYRSMGEKDRAGSSGTPGGPVPPISWPKP